MTFVQIQDRVLARATQSSTVARTRVKEYINEILRKIATSTNCARVRSGTVSINTVDGTKTITSTGLVKVQSVTIPAENRVLEERSADQIRLMDPDASQEGLPRYFVVQKFNATTCTLRLWPTPDAIYAVEIDGVLTGTDLSADADVPGLPEDFHDMLVTGALAKERDHLEKFDLALKGEQEFEQRLSSLKYFLNKSAFLRRQDAERPWWYAR